MSTRRNRAEARRPLKRLRPVATTFGETGGVPTDFWKLGRVSRRTSADALRQRRLGAAICGDRSGGENIDKYLLC